MAAPHHTTARKRLREWWLTPPRTGLQRLIHPWEYRRLRIVGVARVVGGGVATAAGIICLFYDALGWAAFFLVVGVLDLAAGYWNLTIARSASTRT